MQPVILKICTLVISAFVLISLSNVAESQKKDVIKWKKVGPWEIRVDRTLNYGCFLYAGYKGGTGLRFGFTDKSSQAFIMIADNDWTSLEEGKEYPLQIQFDKKPVWTGAATGFRMGSFVSLVLLIPTKQVDFFTEFARSHGIYISYNGKTVANLKLKGSYVATQELLNCQENMQAIKSTNSNATGDPFATRRASTRPKDPFAQ